MDDRRARGRLPCRAFALALAVAVVLPQSGRALDGQPGQTVPWPPPPDAESATPGGAPGWGLLVPDVDSPSAVESLPPVPLPSPADEARDSPGPAPFGMPSITAEWLSGLPPSHPALRRGLGKVKRDYGNFYSCEGLICLTAAFGVAAAIANTDCDSTIQDAWMRKVEPTDLGTFFVGCKGLGEGMYALPIFGTAAVTGLVFDGCLADDVLGAWGFRSLRMFVVGAPPLYALQWATGGSRPDETGGGSSRWVAFGDNNGVSGHAFIGAIPFLAAADMVESPILKGTLYACSTLAGFSRMTTDSHYPSQVFLGWYLAWASARAVHRTELRFGRAQVHVVPLARGDAAGLALETGW